MSNYALIKSAIQNKQQIHATYKNMHRELCPHALGHKNGNEQALFYQFGGESSKGTIVPGDLANWRCLRVSELSDLSVHSGEWFSADNHGTAQTCVGEIDVEISY